MFLLSWCDLCHGIKDILLLYCGAVVHFEQQNAQYRAKPADLFYSTNHEDVFSALCKTF